MWRTAGRRDWAPSAVLGREAGGAVCPVAERGVRPLPCWKPRPDAARSAAAGVRRATRDHRRSHQRLNLLLRGEAGGPSPR
ncbi:hypothetical protein NDU88_008038 [Pleurodeles waltl]|uniref:Uncharacterized protein n=1 Tax=Pleurodeles waltl TaxID=8319 RepID=A0AAV7RRU7_PLEWA|nr:hypothetical protein NDU88_008038 [Pleurodeles waltl]